jgi:hypothetical protein
MPTIFTETSRHSIAEPLGRSTYTDSDLISVSAWTHAHSHLSSSSSGYDRMPNSACQYHASMIAPERYTAQTGYRVGPLERWLDENVRDGGVVALQLGYQLRVDCTCVVMLDGVSGGEDASGN